MSGWRGSTRRARLPKNWPAITRRILERDGRQCRTRRADTNRLCLKEARQVDHVRPGDDHRDENLAAICDYHHAIKSGREGGVASGAARRARRRPAGPPHPGLS